MHFSFEQNANNTIHTDDHFAFQKKKNLIQYL